MSETKSTFSDIRPLIAVPSPRDIQVVKHELDAIENVPKLFVKYFIERDAYHIIQSYFLEHPEFNYLIISPDDLIATKKDYDALINTIINNGGPDKVPVLSGVCNINYLPGYRTTLAISIDTQVHPQRRRRQWNWVDMRSDDWKTKYEKMTLLPVKFSGFAFQFIRRDIVEKIGFHGDLEFNELHKINQDYSYDVIFCYMCNEHKPEPIPIYVNPQVRMVHLKAANNSEFPGIGRLLVGNKEKQVLYVDENGKEKQITKVSMDSYLEKATPLIEKKCSRC